MKMGEYERLGEANEEVVLVAMNYRLGHLGFMCLPSDEAAGNMGLLDQVKNIYRSRATTGRSRLVAAPLRFQAKNSFLCAFYVVI